MDIDENGGRYGTCGEEERFGAEIWKKKTSWIKLRANVRKFKYIPK